MRVGGHDGGRLTRRHFGLGSMALAFNALARPRGAFAHGDRNRSLRFYNLHTGESVAADYWQDGRYLDESLSQIDQVLRDFRTGDVHRIDVRLLDLLHRVAQRLSTHETFHVISGFRSPATNAKLRSRSGGVAKKSLHMKGMAIDVRLPGVALTDLRQVALEQRRGGVGYYPKPDFVHLDIGRVRRW